MNNEQIIKEIESLGFTRSIGQALYKNKRYFEYWAEVQNDGSIIFESYHRHQYADGRKTNYSLKFDDIYEFKNFADELLRFTKKEALA